MRQSVAICLFGLSVLLHMSEQGPHQRNLLRELLRDYNRMERPVANDSLPLTVRFSYTLLQVMNVDEKNQILTTNAWLQMQWFDHYLQWNQSEYPGVKTLRFTTDQVWIPDILLYNSAHDEFDATFKSYVLVNSSGFCEYLPPGIFSSACNVDVRWFPFDVQHCELKFGSWTFDGWLLDLQMQEADLSGYMSNGEWDLLGVPGDRHEIFYECCTEPYSDVTFVVTLRRRTLFYALNFLVPCVLISSLTLLLFILPAQSGEKIGLGITILLSLTVFMLLVAEIMPATSDCIPLIGQYFVSTMVTVGMSVVATVVVLQYHHHDPNSGDMPQWVELVLLQWVPWFLRMKRPGEWGELTPYHSPSNPQTKTCSSPPTTTTTPAPSTLPQSLTSLQASLSQLSQPLPHPPSNPTLQSYPNHIPNLQPNIHPNPNLPSTPHPQPNGHRPYIGFQSPLEPDPAATWRGGGGRGSDTPILHHHPPSSTMFSSPPPQPPTSLDPDPSGSSCVEAGAGAVGAGTCHAQAGVFQAGVVKAQLQALLAEVQFLANRFREQDRRVSVAEKWQFAAAVIDCLCLVGFSVFNIICTITILMAAPNFVEAASKDFF
ncbi:neuronal acetylcholine receptor subunit alpha-7-like isoform X1 [Salmo trutta]|uniref:neuronal acetylcholine receptor subunit alpha-7-like isoform X1 n=1 Tax=Salmo trutta TaxID=8032 RepID=UPI00113089DE|nr:neuronal acetylcholine receptor subunit alpha-7-like isoform X1 [Salmo trutta]